MSHSPDPAFSSSKFKKSQKLLISKSPTQLDKNIKIHNIPGLEEILVQSLHQNSSWKNQKKWKNEIKKNKGSWTQRFTKKPKEARKTREIDINWKNGYQKWRKLLYSIKI